MTAVRTFEELHRVFGAVHQIAEAFDGCRPTKIETLSLPAGFGSEEFQLFCGFNPFGRNWQPQTFAQA